MTDHEERERLAARAFAMTCQYHNGNKPCPHEICADFYAIARLLREPVNARDVFVVFDGPPGPEAGRFVEVEDAEGRSIDAGGWVERADGYWSLKLRVAAAESAPRETPLTSVLAYDAGREEQAAEVERLTERVKELDLAIEKLAAAYKELAEAATSPRLRAAPRVGVEEVIARLHGESCTYPGRYIDVEVYAIPMKSAERILRECWPDAGKEAPEPPAAAPEDVIEVGEPDTIDPEAAKRLYRTAGQIKDLSAGVDLFPDAAAQGPTNDPKSLRYHGTHCQCPECTQGPSRLSVERTDLSEKLSAKMRPDIYAVPYEEMALIVEDYECEVTDLLNDAEDDLTAARATLTACIDERDEALAALFRLAGKGVIHSSETWAGAITGARALLALYDASKGEPT